MQVNYLSWRRLKKRFFCSTPLFSPFFLTQWLHYSVKLTVDISELMTVIRHIEKLENVVITKLMLEEFRCLLSSLYSDVEMEITGFFLSFTKYKPNISTLMHIFYHTVIAV